MFRQLSRIGTSVGLVVFALVVGCSRQSAKSDGSNEQKSFPEAKALDGEVYRTQDRSEAITLVSKDELEIKRGGVNLICKYTRQDGQLRVIANVMGTSQALYYRVTEDGLEDEKGTIFYKPSRLPEADQLAVSKQAMDREARAFGKEVIQRLAVDHDAAFFADRLGPQAKLDFPPSQQQYIMSKFQELGVPAQPIQIDENITWESHFFEPKGYFIAHLNYPARPATLEIATSHPVSRWQLDGVKLSYGTAR